MGGRQTFKSTFITDCLAYYATAYPNSTVIFVTFDNTNRDAFSNQKFRRGCLEGNSILKSSVSGSGLGNVKQITFKNGSVVYLLTDEGKYSQVEGKSPTIVLFDESQYQDLEHLPVRDNFYFLCKECHKKYDDSNKTTKIVRNEDLQSHPVSPNTLNTDVLPQEGEEFTEKQLYEKFQVRNSGGIRPTVKNKAIILINSFFSEHMGGYKDHGDEKEGFVYYVGEGEGTQDFVRNNKSILESQYNGYALLYFEKHVRDKLVFRYQLEYDSWTHEMQANSKGQNRQVIVFKLKII